MVFGNFVLSVLLLVVVEGLVRMIARAVRRSRINGEAFRKKLSSPLAEYMRAAIGKELEPFVKGGISRTMIEELFRGEHPGKHRLVRVSIRGGQVTAALSTAVVDHPSVRSVLNIFEQLTSLVSLPDVELVLSVREARSASWPQFFFSRTKGSVPLLVISDVHRPFSLRAVIQKYSGGMRREGEGAVALWRGERSTGQLGEEELIPILKTYGIMGKRVRQEELDKRKKEPRTPEDHYLYLYLLLREYALIYTEG